MRLSRRYLLLVIALFGVAACGLQSETGDGDKGGKARASIHLTFPEGALPDCPTCAAAPTYVTSATLTITGAALTDPVVQSIPLDTGVVEGELTPGIYTFSITVVTTSFGTFTGASTSLLSPGGNNPVGIKLAVNAPPTIESLNYAPANPTPGSVVTLTAVASDPDNDPLTYIWSPTGGTISGSGATVAMTTSATATTISVTLTVEDGHGGAATASKTILVPPATPTGLTCNAGYATLGLTWNSSAGATSYKVYSNVATSTTTQTAFADPTGVHDTRTYRVAAVNAAGESATTAAVSCQEQTGLKWTQRGTVGQGRIDYGAGKFVMGATAAASADRVYTSTDGITWTQVTLPATGANMDDLVWTGSRFVAAGGNGGLAYYYTSDATGTTWAASAGLGATGDRFRTVVGNGANFLGLYSTAGGNHTCVGAGVFAGCSLISLGAGHFPSSGISVAGGQTIIPDTGGSVWRETGGGWARVAGPVLDTQFKAAAYGGGTYVVVGLDTLGGGNQAPVYSSSDGVTWTARTSNNTGSTLNDVIRVGSWFIAAGSGISFSADGAAWEAPVGATGRGDYYSIAYGGNRLVAVDTTGVIYTSP